MSDLMETIDLWFVHAMFVGQTVFLVMWGILPWWREWVGRALMIKSVAIWLLLLVSLSNYYVLVIWLTRYPYMDQVTLAIHGLVVLGIWSQVAALWYEKHAAQKGQREVTGTEKDGVLQPAYQDPHGNPHNLGE